MRRSRCGADGCRAMPAMGAATLAMALGLHGLMSARTTVAGTLLPLADADAATYGIRAVYQLDENTYYVVGTQKGFQSDVEAGVTLDSTECCRALPSWQRPRPTTSVASA